MKKVQLLALYAAIACNGIQASEINESPIFYKKENGAFRPMTQQEMLEQAQRSPFATEHITSLVIKNNKESGAIVTDNLKSLHKLALDKCLERAAFFDEQDKQTSLFGTYFEERYSSPKMREFNIRAYNIKDHNTAFATENLPYNTYGTFAQKHSFEAKDNELDGTLNGWSDAFVDRLGNELDAQYKQTKTVNKETLHDFIRFIYGFGQKGSPLSMGRVAEKTYQANTTAYHTTTGGQYVRIASPLGYRWATLIEPTINPELLTEKYAQHIEQNGFSNWNELQNQIQYQIATDIEAQPVVNNIITITKESQDMHIKYQDKGIEKSVVVNNCYSQDNRSMLAKIWTQFAKMWTRLVG